ncbi:MAG TPA: rhamnulose-1-phosphate aldolase [Bacteroidales bacterium]|nr:rhamnulose-1-phosphate aldolase [Bacteroidales bacterium]
MKEIINSNGTLRKIVLEVAEVARFLWQRGWAERNAGNISVNLNDILTDDIPRFADYPYFKLQTGYPELSRTCLFVTGTGKRMRNLADKPVKNALMIRIDDEGVGYYIISGKKNSAINLMPTSELPTHLSIHQMIRQRGTDEKVVIHTHASELIALTQVREFCDEKRLNNLFWGMHPETKVFVPKGVGYVPYITPGSIKIAAKTLRALENHDVALWEKHGVFSIGADVIETFDVIDILVKSAKIFFMCRNAGLEPEGLTAEQLDELGKIVF